MTTKIPGIFQPIDPYIGYDDAIVSAGAMAEFLYIRGLLYIRRNKADGRIKKSALPEIGDGIPNQKKISLQLVSAGLWIDDGLYWSVKNWEKWNTTKQERDSLASVKSRAGAKGGHVSKHSSLNPSAECEFCVQEGWVK